MNQTHPQSAYYSEVPLTPQRSTFLNVLTILTIIASSFGILSAIGTYMFSKSKFYNEIQAKNKANLKNTKEEKGLLGMLNSFSKNMEPLEKEQQKSMGLITVVTVLAEILCLLGAIFMRKLKRVGFFIYLVGEWSPAILSAALFAGVSGAAFLIGSAFFIPALFTILYATRFKELVH
jgi:hypothetical protein